MRERSSVAVVPRIEPAEIEGVLWAACEEECSAAGEAVVAAIAVSVANNVSGQLELRDAGARDAAVALVACACFVKDLAGAHSTFMLREQRFPSAHDLVREVERADAHVVECGYAPARCFLAQRAPC